MHQDHASLLVDDVLFNVGVHSSMLWHLNCFWTVEKAVHTFSGPLFSESLFASCPPRKHMHLGAIFGVRARCVKALSLKSILLTRHGCNILVSNLHFESWDQSTSQ